MRAKFDYGELKEFKKNLKVFKKQVPSMNVEILENYARHIIIRASENTPIMWGNLQDHWKYEIVSSGKKVTKAIIINDLPYASFVEEGHKQSARFVPGMFINTPGGTKFQYMPWVRGQGIMLHAGWVEGRWMFKTTMIEMEFENVLEKIGNRLISNKWYSIMGIKS